MCRRNIKRTHRGTAVKLASEKMSINTQYQSFDKPKSNNTGEMQANSAVT